MEKSILKEGEEEESNLRTNVIIGDRGTRATISIMQAIERKRQIDERRRVDDH